MKKLLMIIAAIFCVVGVSSSQNIGIVRNAQYRITANVDPIKKQWEKLLQEQNSPATLTNFEIQAGVDKSTGKTFYILLGTNRDKSVKIGRPLKLNSGYLTFYKENEPQFGIVVCSGCSGACMPTMLDGQLICDPACAVSGQECKRIIVIPAVTK